MVIRRHLRNALLLALASAPMTRAQELAEPPTEPAVVTIVLMGELVGRVVTESFQFAEQQRPVIDLYPQLQVKFPLPNGVLELHPQSRGRTASHALVWTRRLVPDDPLLDDLRENRCFRIVQRRIDENDRAPAQNEMVEVIMEREFEDLDELERIDPELAAAFSQCLLFYEAVTLYSRLTGFHIVQSPPAKR